jgi:hypothetical protein
VFSSLWTLLCNGAAIFKTILVGKNTPAMVANKTAENNQASTDKITKDAATGDVDALREDIET